MRRMLLRLCEEYVNDGLCLGRVREFPTKQPGFALTTDQIFTSFLADQQNKHSDSYQQGKQSTDGERESPVPSI